MPSTKAKSKNLMPRKINFSKSSKNIILTSLFCLVITLLTDSVWGGEFYIHFLVSFGYGYCAIFSEVIIQRLFPSLSTLRLNLSALTGALILGSINASYWLKHYDQFSSLDSLKPVIFLGLVFTAICFYFFHVNEQKLLAGKALEMAKRKQSEQEKALILSQLNQLQSQIEPHFLFNTLANIQALIELDAKKASTMLAKLTDLLRASLSINRASLTNLEQETQLLNAYLAIQKIRLGDRLTYQIDNQIEEPISLPPFIIQPLVENAITHGIEPSSKGGEVCIYYKIIKKNLHIEIVDSGLGIQEHSKTKGNGISLTNIRERLANLYEGQASLSLIENQQGGITSIISIPIAQLKKLQGEQLL